MKILNLYAGLGGNRKSWSGHPVTAVEQDERIARIYSDNFPEDEVVVGDAHTYLLEHYEEFDFIWSSPPCQSHSRMVKATRHKVRKFPDLKLYEEVIFLKHFFTGLWVVENVVPYYGYLIEPSHVISRHPLWCNFFISDFKMKYPKNFITIENSAGAELLKKEYGIRYEGNIYLNGNHSPTQVLRNCVHPKMGLHILKSAEKEGSK